MGLLSWLFGSKPQPKAKPKRYPPKRKATERQLRYAKRLGIDVPKNATLWQVSKMIDAAESANPQMRAERLAAIDRKRVERFGPELIAQEQQWQQLADQRKWIAAVYRSGKSVKVDLLQIEAAEVNEKGKLRVHVTAGKIVTHKDTGPLVDMGRDFELDPTKLLWSQVVNDFDVDEFERFDRTFTQAEKMARKFS
jgi:hypothetical protein